MRYAIQAEEVLTPDPIQNAVVIVEDGRIEKVGPASLVEVPAGLQTINLGAAKLAPGFIDVHIHGAMGYDTMKPDDDGLLRMRRFLASKGVTSFVPTTVTASKDLTLSALKYLGGKVGHRNGELAAEALGIHFEGPFISQVKRGVHPPADILAPSVEFFDEMWNACGGTASVMTIAPELPGAPELIAHAARKGVRISLGHSDATKAQARAGFKAGGTHATHTFNAMRPLDHREPGLVGVVLTERSMTADMIIDGVHIDPAVVDLFLRSKGRDGAVLISDAMSATGMPDGTYQLGEFEVKVSGPRCESEGRLAGSVLTLDLAVRNVMKMAGWSLAESVRLATLNPARMLGIEAKKGTLRVGADADMVVLSADGNVLKTIIAGEYRD